MSTYYGYHCKTCPPVPDDTPYVEDRITADSPYWDNHGDDRLRALAQCAPELKALLDKVEQSDCSGWLELHWLGCYDSPDPMMWLMAHYGHDIELMDEYGRASPIEA
jgi:hypothetical protein